MKLQRNGVLAVLVFWAFIGFLWAVVHYELFLLGADALGIVMFVLMSAVFYEMGVDDSAED